MDLLADGFLDLLQIFGDKLKWISGVLVAVGAAYPVVRIIWRRIKKNIVEPYILKPVETVHRMADVIEVVEKELKPNGGSSLRDAINRVESCVKTNNEFCRFILSNLDGGFFEANSHGDCIWVSKNWMEMTDLSFNEALGNGWINSVVPEDRQKVKDEWFAAIKEKRDFKLNYRVCPDNPIWVKGTTQFLRGADSKIQSIVGLIERV